MPAVGSLPARGASRRQVWVWHREQRFVALGSKHDYEQERWRWGGFPECLFFKVEQNSALLPVYSYLTPVLATYSISF